MYLDGRESNFKRSTIKRPFFKLKKESFMYDENDTAF